MTPKHRAPTFGENLRDARREAGLTQTDLAKKLKFKRTTPISIWERSKHVPEPKTIVKLAAALGCPTARLLQGVVTRYDELRGYQMVLAPAQAAALIERFETLEESDDARWLELGRALSTEMRIRHVAFIEAYLSELGESSRGRDARFGKAASSLRVSSSPVATAAKSSRRSPMTAST